MTTTPETPDLDPVGGDRAKDPVCLQAAHGFLVHSGDRGPCPTCDRPRCHAPANSRPGERCRNFPKPELVVCVFHGGNTDAAKAKSAELVAEKAAAKALPKALWDPDAPPVTNHVAALQKLAGQLGTLVQVLGSRLSGAAACEHCGRGEDPPASLDGGTAAMFKLAIGQQRQLLTDMDRAGITRRALELRAADMQVLVTFLDRALRVAELGSDVRAAIARAYFGELRGWTRDRTEQADTPPLILDGVQDFGADSETMLE